MKRFQTAALALATAVLLAACGGGSSDNPRDTGIKTVKTFGDSLADVGTFGVKATVQGPESLLFFERVALAYGQADCNFFAFTGTTFVPNTAKTGCLNFAIGGGVINPASSNLTPADPRTINVQFNTALAAGGFNAGDLVLVDGGGNDAAALVGAFLALNRGQPAGFQNLMLTQLPAATVQAGLAGGATGVANLGGAYMQALADTFVGQIRSNVLARGATRVLVTNIPAITNTPRFQGVLDQVAAANGGGAAGAAARAQVEALARGWVAAFNTRLAAAFAADDRVIVVDGASEFDRQIANPAQYALTNVRTPACPVTGTGSDGLPSYNFATCTAAALSAAPPAGVTGGAGWWTSYAFSDGFHPSPYLHQLTYQLIALSLTRKGWL